jgi:ABC-type branched-subunit amino acid transport system substrate-binding protein
MTLAGAGALALTACSSSNNDSSGGSTAPSGSQSVAAAATSVASGAISPAASQVPSDNPVVVGVMYTDNNPLGVSPEIKDAANAASEFINSHGGIGGRAVKVITCNGQNDPQHDVQCATEFANDGAITVQGLDAVWGSIGPGIIAKSNVINQTEPLAGPEFSGPNAFPWLGINVTGGAAMAAYVKQQNASAACLYIDVAALKPACADLFEKPLGKSIPLVPISATANDMSQYAAKVAQTHADYVAINSDKSRAIGIIKAASQLGYKPHWMMIADFGQPDFFKALGNLATGTIFFSDLRLASDTSDPDTAIFNSAMKQYAPNAIIDNQSVMAFSNLMTLKRLGDQKGGAKMTKADLRGLLANIHGVKQFMGPTLDSATHLPGLPQATHTGAYLNIWDGSKLVPAGAGYFETTD